ncbi:MAG: PD-(D/E)XK nuclease family protein [Alphaproteobacteria bacterium]|nr:PD-(D/E)XK nuclease family protein [Alphaproteobacteria bacterium]
MIYNIGLNEDFAERLSSFVLEKYKSNPFGMACVEIILPTKRACLTVKEAFLHASQDKSLLLPKLTALYEMDNLDEDLPPKMPKLNRTLLLTKLCSAKPNIASIDKAVMIAIGLGELLDEFYQYEADVSLLNTLVQEKQFAEHWNETVTFLDIIHTTWPKILAEYGQIDEMDYTIRMIKSYAKKWADIPPTHPIIMAGFDGAIPAVIELAKVVNSLEDSVLFLNGVDTLLSPDEFKSLPPIHAQYPLKRLLDALKIYPNEILNYSSEKSESELLMHEVLKPAEETDSWQYVQGITSNSLSHIKRFDCENTSHEALTVALLLREVLETPTKTAAFVTTDRALARRVSVEMKRWGIELDDSAGTPLLQTPIGIYLLLLSNVALTPQNGNNLLALLKHPLSADTINPTLLRLKIKNAEKKARRDNTLLEYQTNTDLSILYQLFTKNILYPFEVLLKTHIEVAEALATSHDRAGYERLWENDAGQVAYTFLTELLQYAHLLGDIDPAYYPKILELLMASLTVRPKYGMHPRLDILGPIEARFHKPDVIIVGGLNEGTFPQLPDMGPWLNRPMRVSLGLPAPENKIAVSAMDFANCFCAKEVYLTRSLKNDGAPTIPSRFLSRMEAVLTAADITWTLNETLASLLDKPHKNDPIIRPAPKPPVSARPQKLSVTKIELWMRDPYAIYARYILKLYPLNSLETPQKQVLFGNAIHKSFEFFIEQNPHSLDLDALLKLGENNLKSAGFNEGELAFYMPKFKAIASWFIARQAERIDHVKLSFVEQTAECIIEDMLGHPFTLYGTADRIDLMKDGSVEIIDYKTGTPPSAKEVRAGYAPQLPLEGYLLSQGGFNKVGAKHISDLSYWRLSSKFENAKITSVLNKKETDFNVVENSYLGLKKLITIFNDENVAYESCPAPEFAPRYNDYEHLSRSKEWLTVEDEEEEA